MKFSIAFNNHLTFFVMKRILRFKLVFLLFVFSSVGGLSANGQKNVPNIIFETDMGNDVDDALALDIIYKYLDRGLVNLLAINSNKQSKYSTEYIHLMNHWYGYPRIPIGKVIYGADSENDAKKYAEYVCLMKNEQGKPLFARPKFNYDAIPDAVKLYRKILSKQPDTSVTIISVGFSTNIARLLQTEPDSYSSLSGKELVAKKVKMLSVMAGSFGETKPIREYNIVKDIPAAKLIADQWPTPIIYAPFEIGIEVQYPGKSIENDFQWVQHHPVVEAYKYYLKMPYDRPTWDLLALLYVTENSPKYFGMSTWGSVKIDEKGSSSFVPDPKGNRAYLTVSKEQAKTILNRFVELITAKPAKLK
jgi:inosine-uridine nucleoside N-ribohydrolase